MIEQKESEMSERNFHLISFFTEFAGRMCENGNNHSELLRSGIRSAQDLGLSLQSTADMDEGN